MRLLTLNAWGGRGGKAFDALLSRLSTSVDIFCFQEVFHHAGEVYTGRSGIASDPELYDRIGTMLPEHVGYFRPSVSNRYGIASFVRKGSTVEHESVAFVYREEGYEPSPERTWDHARHVQALSIRAVTGEVIHLFNFHGTSGGGMKGDTKERLEQSDRLVAFMNRFVGKKVLCGDFNLLPETESIRRIEAAGFRNLISEYRISSTRTSLYDGSDAYADYVMVGNDVQVIDFAVLPDEVSDHFPLLLDFS